MEKDLVSIIIPVFNAEKYIEETINSILVQTYSKWELILVNDCSTDNSKLIYDKYAYDIRIKWIDLQINSGPAIARNRGIDISKGEFICFIDSDDKWDKEKLEIQHNFMKEKECAFSYHSYEFANEKCIPNGRKVIAKDILTYKAALKNNIISTITVMFNMKKIDKELIKMPNIKYVEDTATWWKILKKGYNAYGIKNIFAYYRRQKKTNSSNKLRTQKNLWYVYRKEEGLGFFVSIYYIFLKNLNALIRRI